MMLLLELSKLYSDELRSGACRGGPTGAFLAYSARQY